MRLFGQSTKFLALLASLSIAFWTIGCANDASTSPETNTETNTETDGDSDGDSETEMATDGDGMEESSDDAGDITIEDDVPEAGTTSP